MFPEFTFATFKEEAVAWRNEATVWKKAAAFARRRHAYVVVNQPSRDENHRVYSETRVYSPLGYVTAVYRKRVLANMDKKAGYSPGPRAAMAQLPFARIGILICKDAFQPQTGFSRYTNADILLVQFAHPGVNNRAAQEAKGFNTATMEMKRLRNTRLGWKDLEKPYLAVNKTGSEGNYTLAGGTFAARSSGTIVTKVDSVAKVLAVDFPLGENKRIVPSPIAVP